VEFSDLDGMQSCGHRSPQTVPNCAREPKMEIPALNTLLNPFRPNAPPCL
jgi:hypothetical protein